MQKTLTAMGAAVLVVLTGSAVRADTVPMPDRPDHVVVVVLENKRYDAVVGHPKTPYLSALAARGANFINAYGETHPSQPNYLALFSGTTQGVTDNRCGHTFHGVPNLGSQLLAAGYTFIGYSEDLPSTGWTGCGDGEYVRRHNPWVNFDNVPAAGNRPLREFPTDYRDLPTVAFVVPGLCHDMHDCPKADADAWLRHTLNDYVTWAEHHNSVLVVTFDEDNGTDGNHIPTIVLGEHIATRQHPERIDHYSLLRAIEDCYDLTPLGNAADRGPATLR